MQHLYPTDTLVVFTTMVEQGDTLIYHGVLWFVDSEWGLIHSEYVLGWDVWGYGIYEFSHILKFIHR